MKLTISFFSFLSIVLIAWVACLIFFNIERDMDGYDILIYSKNEEPVRFVGIRYKEDFMLHIYKKKTIGDAVDGLLSIWKKRADEKQDLANNPQ
jgi:ABC-type uncharacterized transport system permease subunit